MTGYAKYKMVLRCECGHEVVMTGMNHQRDFRSVYDGDFGYDRWVDTYAPDLVCDGCGKEFEYFGESHRVDEYIKGE